MLSVSFYTLKRIVQQFSIFGWFERLHNWRWCRLSFASKFIRVTFTARWMKWVPSTNRWSQSGCGQIFRVCGVYTTFDTQSQKKANKQTNKHKRHCWKQMKRKKRKQTDVEWFHDVRKSVCFMMRCLNWK